MRAAHLAALIAAAASQLSSGCTSSYRDCEALDCASVNYRWPCPGCARPLLLGQGATATFFVSWTRAHYGGSFCPASPRAISSDSTVLDATFSSDCASLIRLTGVAPGRAHVDLYDGEGLVGRWEQWEGWEIGVAAIHHLAIVRSDGGALTRQDPPALEATVGESFELVTYAYDDEGHSLFADNDTAIWLSDAPSIIGPDGAMLGAFIARAAGEANVTCELAGSRATVRVVARMP